MSIDQKAWFLEFQRQKTRMETDRTITLTARQIWEFLCIDVHQPEDLIKFTLNLQSLYRGNGFKTDLGLEEEVFLNGLRELDAHGYGAFDQKPVRNK